MCCLKRPFADQSQPRIRLESEAVLSLLAAESTTVDFIHSAALRLENRQHPIVLRAARVDALLDQNPVCGADAFATCDDRLRKAVEWHGQVRVRVLGVAELAEEVLV